MVTLHSLLLSNSSGRRYVAQRHFEQQLFFVQSPVIQEKWRRTFFELMSKAFVFLSLTPNESNLLNEINSWHLNMSAGDARLDNLLDFDDLFDCSTSFPSSSTPVAFLFQPMTTLAAASRTLELWKEQSSPLLPTPVDRLDPDRRENSSIHPGECLAFPLDRSSAERTPDQFVRRLRPASVVRSTRRETIGHFQRFSSRDRLRFFFSFSFNCSLVVHSAGRVSLSFQTSLLPSLSLLVVERLSARFPASDGDERRAAHVEQRAAATSFSLHSQTEVFPAFPVEQFRTESARRHVVSTGISAFDFHLRISLHGRQRAILLSNLLDERSDAAAGGKSVVDDDFAERFHYHEYQRRSQRKTKASDESQALANGWWHTPVSSRAKRSSVNQLKIRPPIYF